jgi:hypothetical protein
VIDNLDPKNPKECEFVYKKGDTPIKNFSVIWEMYKKTKGDFKGNVKKGQDASDRMEKRTEDIIQKNSDLEGKPFGVRHNRFDDSYCILYRALLFTEK